MRILHCSDVHITQPQYWKVPPWRLGWRRCVAMLELKFGGRAHHYAAAGTTLAQIAADATHHQVDHLCVSGDLTAYAMESEFAGALKALQPWSKDRMKCSVIPGNHDTYSPDAIARGWFDTAFGHLLVSDLPQYRAEGAYPFVRLLGEDAAVVGLNSARMPLVPGFSFGRLGKRQLDALAALRDDPRLQGRALVVMVHHAPFTAKRRPDKPLHGLVDARALLKLLPGPRFAILHGHIHQRYFHPATADAPNIFGAGSSTELGHEGYWVIEAKDGRILQGEKHVPTRRAA